MFEDAPNGVEAALAAGMHVVWVPHEMCLKTDVVSSVKPTLQLHSLADFKPEQFGLPPFSADDSTTVNHT